MKKLLTIICAFSLIMAFTLPAMADTDVDVDDTQGALTFQGQTNQAQKGGEIDNDGLDLDTGDIAVNNDGNTIGNTDNSNQGNNSGNDNDGTDVDVTTGDLLSNNTDNSDNSVNTDNRDYSDDDGVDVDTTIDDINVSDIANDKSDDDLLDNKEGTIQVSDVANDKSDDDLADNDMNDNMAAAAMGGFAIAVDIEDIELNLASTTSISGISQNSSFGPNASASNDGKKDGDSGAWAGFESYCHSVDADVFDNIGVFGANFSAGHFNNQANLNSVNVTVQY